MTAKEIIDSINTHYKQGFVATEIHAMLKYYKFINQEIFYDKLSGVSIYMNGKDVVYLREDVEWAVGEAIKEAVG